jgi:D-alanyl-D-alanine carboxypeptidase/D-alanyl-D-alanine-endopeptidase (penicillin-binding protein 4)
LLVPAPVWGEESLANRLEAVMHRPEYRQAHWGILIVDADTGKTVYAHNADQLFVPASVTKLYSCSTALATFGAEYRFETPVYRRGLVESGWLHGDLILVAQGDLTLGGRTLPNGHLAFRDTDHIYANGSNSAELTHTDPLAGLKALARQVADAGIRRVDGDVLIDDRLFDHNRGSGSGPDILTPIVVNDNVVDVLITPAAEAGRLAEVTMRPVTSFIQMDAEVMTVAAGKKTEIEVRSVAPHRFSVRGQIPVGHKPVVHVYAVDDPAGFARALFIDCLRREGLTVAASPLQPPQHELPERDSYERLTRVAVYTSVPFAETVKVTLKVSHNLYASIFPLLVAVKNGKRTLRDGLRIEREFLRGIGVDVGTISFAGGAGGANADSVTPRATIQLLQGLARRPDYKILEAGLPVLGVDGTLASVVPTDSPARGKVRAKTGTYTWYDMMNDRSLLRAKTLAGTMITAGGRPLLFVIFLNNVPLPRGVSSTRAGKTLGQMCEIIYLHAPREHAENRP